MKKPLALAFALLAAACPALANDSTAELRTGGIVLLKSSSIAMDEEDLFLSPSQVKVHYVFRNTGSADQTVTLAFPMPDSAYLSVPEEYQEQAKP